MLKLNNSETAFQGSWYRVRSQEVEGAIIPTLIMIIISREELDGRG